jgi:hypothetical protein
VIEVSLGWGITLMCFIIYLFHLFHLFLLLFAALTHTYTIAIRDSKKMKVVPQSSVRRTASIKLSSHFISSALIAIQEVVQQKCPMPKQ